MNTLLTVTLCLLPVEGEITQERDTNSSRHEVIELAIVRVQVPITKTQTAHFTGTHIGNGWILMCGHCCQQQQKSVEVRILCSHNRNPVRSVRGTVVCCDAVAEVGLIHMEAGHGLRTQYRLAPRDIRLRSNDAAIMYDWLENESGLILTAKHVQITGINKYLGPATVETTGAPHDGASGSPLVLRKTGQVIGVTSGVNITHDRAIHAGLEPVYRMLEQCGASPTENAQMHIESSISSAHDPARIFSERQRSVSER